MVEGFLKVEVSFPKSENLTFNYSDFFKLRLLLFLWLPTVSR